MKNLRIISLYVVVVILVQSLCSAQGVPQTDWEFRAKGDTVITIRTIDFFPDTLFSRTGKMIALSNDSIFVISETDATIPEFTKVSILHLDINGKLSQHYYSSTSSVRKTNRNINILQNSHDVLWWFAMDQFGAMGTSGNRNIKNLRNHGWVKNPYYDVTQSYLQNKINNIPNASAFGTFPIINADSASFIVPPFRRTVDFMVFSAGTTTSSEGVKPHIGVHDLRPAVNSSRTALLTPLLSNQFAPISYGFDSTRFEHILLAGNVYDSAAVSGSYEILFIDTSLVELSRIQCQPIQIGSETGKMYPHYIYPQKNQIVVVGYVLEGTNNFPFISIHSTDGSLLQSKIVRTNTVINSGNISADGKQIVLCGAKVNSSNKKEFYVVHLSTETLQHTEYLWGRDSVRSELFDIAFGSNNSIIVTGGEDNNLYVAKFPSPIITSIVENNQDKNMIDVFPNPTSNNCTITLKNSEPVQSKLTIQNMQGQTVATVFEGIPNQTEVKNISIAHLPIGSYFITMENGNSTYRTKFIVKR